MTLELPNKIARKVRAGSVLEAAQAQAEKPIDDAAP